VNIVIRSAMTLIELTVTMAVMALLVVAALPAIRPAVDNRRIREAARALHIYISAARNRAMEIGRPAGIALVPYAVRDQDGSLQGSMSFVVTVDQVESPPPYCGDSVASYAALNWRGSTLTATLSDGNMGLATRNNIAICNGDLIQLNNQGPLYVIANASAYPALELALNDPVYIAPWLGGEKVPYKIFRQPQKMHATPLILPLGAVIDLESSGTDQGDTRGLYSSNGLQIPSIIISFTPNGSLDYIYINHNPYPVSQPVYLMVGKREAVPSQATMHPYNWEDLNNLWVAIQPFNGSVSVNKVANSQPNVATKTYPTMPSTIFDSRYYARSSLNLGGN
jgi:prepilin-type N-terminal cleavage/methylation domain-containing protein